jgi:hypothetical protein
LRPLFFTASTTLGVFPSVDDGSVDRLLVRKDVLEALDEIATPFFKYRTENRWNVEDFCDLGQGDDVVDDHRRLVAVQIRELLRLMVDQHEDAVFGAEQRVETGLRGFSHWYLLSRVGLVL